MTNYKNLIERNDWFADKIPVFGDFGKDVALQLKKNSDAIEALVKERDELAIENRQLACNLKGKHAVTGATYKHLCDQLASVTKQRDELVAACKETIDEAAQILADNFGRNCESDYNRCYSMVYRNLDALAKVGADKGEK